MNCFVKHHLKWIWYLPTYFFDELISNDYKFISYELAQIKIFSGLESHQNILDYILKVTKKILFLHFWNWIFNTVWSHSDMERNREIAQNEG